MLLIIYNKHHLRYNLNSNFAYAVGTIFKKEIKKNVGQHKNKLNLLQIDTKLSVINSVRDHFALPKSAVISSIATKQSQKNTT